MKKTLIALAVTGTVTGMACAQSNVQIYGVMDTGYAYTSGSSWRMGSAQESRIGFRGTEDLGNGLKATFSLERRFDLNDGSNGGTSMPAYRGRNSRGSKDWEGDANIGLAGNWGQVRIGYVAELTTETIRKFDPFYQYGVGSMLWSAQRSEGIDNTLRYDSPKWAGFSFGLSYSLGKNTKTGGEMHDRIDGKYVDNDGYAINLSYDNYGFTATANWSRIADSNDSDVWNIGVGYKFGPAKVTLLYENTSNEGTKQGDDSIYLMNYRDNAAGSWTNRRVKSDQENWLLGLEWDIGPGQFDASVQYGQLDNVKNLSGGSLHLNKRGVAGTGPGYKKVDEDILKYAIGYTYNLSKRTSAYVQVAYTDFDTERGGLYYTGLNRDDMWGFQLGMNHKF